MMNDSGATEIERLKANTFMKKLVFEAVNLKSDGEESEKMYIAVKNGEYRLFCVGQMQG